MSMSRVISKVGKKLWYPDIPANWVRVTAEEIESRQNYLLRNRILNHLNSYKDDVKLEEYEDDEKYCFYRRRCRYKQHHATKYGGFSWPNSSIGYHKIWDLFCTNYTYHQFNNYDMYMRQGTSFDVASMLKESSSCGGYLIRGNGDKVEIETSLRGKNVVVCCFYVLVFWSDSWGKAFRALSAHYSASASYEMVIVANMIPNWAHDEDAFYHFLSAFPPSCLAVPFEDALARNSVCQKLGFQTFPISLFVDNYQKVGYHEPLSCTGSGFGVYPFCRLFYPGINIPSDEPFTRLDSFLDSDFVYKINCNTTVDDMWGDKVPVFELKHKLVGLYLCYDGNFIRTLDLISQECQARNQEFQIVMVYIPYQDRVKPRFFIEVINNVLRNLNILSDNSNWCIAPFNDSLSRSIWEFYDYFEEDKLIILEPHTNYADRCGKLIFDMYGIDGYPFTREVRVNKEVEAIRATTLESWLVYGSRDYVLRMNFSNDTCNVDKVPIADLRGKIILLYVCSSYPRFSMLNDFLTWYDWNKTTRLSDFDVVFVCVDEQFPSSVRTPWLVCPYDPQYATFVDEKILNSRGDILVAFGKDGQIITLKALDLLYSYGPKGFPTFEWYLGLCNEVISFLDDIEEMYITELAE